MATAPQHLNIFDDDRKPRDWRPKKLEYTGPLRLARLCILGMFLPAALIAGPIYLKYRVYSEQLYPLAATDQRLIDGKISTTWCQRQVVKVNTTFNAYLMNGEPQIIIETTPVSMIRHLILEDDMKEYWGFYLLRGSSVTVSTCVRWPGASLTIIRGHKHLHECAFIGDDSSEELEELFEIVEEQGLLNGTGMPQNLKPDGPSNAPEKMKRARQDVEFHHKSNAPNLNSTIPSFHSSHHYSSHELDATAMRQILTNLFAKTLIAKNKQKEMRHHHYEGVYRESSNIEKPAMVKPNKFSRKQAETTQKSFKIQSVTELSKKKDDEIVTEIIDKLDNTEKKSNLNSTDDIVQEILKKIDSLGDRGENVLQKLLNTLKENNRRIKRQVVLSSPSLFDELNDEVREDEDAAIEEQDLHPDGIAEDRGSVNETTLNDRSNSEFWSSFSSSEERLIECKGLILNLPLTPHHQCAPKHQDQHVKASIANTITYKVPVDGYFIFRIKNEKVITINWNSKNNYLEN